MPLATFAACRPSACASRDELYMTHWGAWEGLRELVQGCHDGALAAAGEARGSLRKAWRAGRGPRRRRRARLGGYDERRGRGVDQRGRCRPHRALARLLAQAARRDVVECFGEASRSARSRSSGWGGAATETEREMWRLAEPTRRLAGRGARRAHHASRRRHRGRRAAARGAFCDDTTLELVGIDEAAFALAAHRLLWLEP